MVPECDTGGSRPGEPVVGSSHNGERRGGASPERCSDQCSSLGPRQRVLPLRAKSHAKGYSLPDGMRNGRRRMLSVLTKVDFAVIAEPLRWVTVAGIHIRKRDGEVNVIEIKVVKTPVPELFLRQRLNLYLKTALSQRTFSGAKAPHDHGHGMCSRAKN